MALSNTNLAIAEDEAADENCILHVYYTGHGYTDGKDMYAVLGNAERSQARRTHAIEKELRYFSATQVAEFFVFFDCPILNAPVNDYDLDENYEDDMHHLFTFSCPQAFDGAMPANW